MYLSTSTSTEDFPEMYLSTFQVLYKLYLSTDVLKYKVLLPASDGGHLKSTYTSGTDKDVHRQMRKYYAGINTLIRRFYACSYDVKCYLFRLYISNMYCGQFLFNPKQTKNIGLSTSEFQPKLS